MPLLPPHRLLLRRRRRPSKSTALPRRHRHPKPPHTAQRPKTAGSHPNSPCRQHAPPQTSHAAMAAASALRKDWTMVQRMKAFKLPKQTGKEPGHGAPPSRYRSGPRSSDTALRSCGHPARHRPDLLPGEGHSLCPRRRPAPQRTWFPNRNNLPDQHHQDAPGLPGHGRAPGI